MGKVVQHFENIVNPLPELLRSLASHQTQIITPLSNGPQRQKLRSGAVKKFTFHKKSGQISFE